jgi:hypothetical protein
MDAPMRISLIAIAVSRGLNVTDAAKIVDATVVGDALEMALDVERRAISYAYPL